jgi:hypothetical protein
VSLAKVFVSRPSALKIIFSSKSRAKHIKFPLAPDPASDVPWPAERKQLRLIDARDLALPSALRDLATYMATTKKMTHLQPYLLLLRNTVETRKT